MDVDAIQREAVNFLLGAGDGYGGIATFFDGGVVEAAGGGVGGGVASGAMYGN